MSLPGIPLPLQQNRHDKTPWSSHGEESVSLCMWTSTCPEALEGLGTRSFCLQKRYWVIFVTSSNRWLQGIGCWKLWHLSGEPLEVISGSAGCFAYMRFLFCVVIPSGKCWEIWGWKKLEDFLKPSSSAWGENIRIHSECTCANIGRGKSLPSQVSLGNRANLFMYNVSLTASKCIFLCLSVVW